MKSKFSELIRGINRAEVILLLILALINIAAPFYTFYGIGSQHFIGYLMIHHTIRRLIGVVLLFVIWKLYKRVSTAWTIAMVALSLAIFQYLLIYHSRIANPWFALELVSYFVLLFSRNYYCRKTSWRSLQKGLLAYLVYAAFVFFNAMIAILRGRGTVPFLTCVRQTVDVMFDTDNLNLMEFSRPLLYHRFVFWFSWGCILIGLLFFLTPYIGAKARTQGEFRRVHDLVKRYGDNCSAYLALEKDKHYLFAQTVEGAVAYGIVQDTMVVLGEPLCAPEDLLPFLTEIKEYCRENAYSLLFLNVTSPFLEEYRKMGMGAVKCGEEPRFFLPEYSIAGGKGSKIRLNINHATNVGLKVLEYRPNEQRNPRLEQEIMNISQEWFSMKKCSELVFTMGEIGFENPMERRYFYAINPQGTIEGFIVFLPFKKMDGYVADVTRYRKDAERGIVEKIFYEAAMTFKTEGIEWASLALAPLARLEEESDAAAKLLNTVYERMNDVYGFKALYQAKLKYNPTHWEPCYYVYYPPRLTPSVAYSVIRIQNSRGVLDYAKALLRNGFWRRIDREKAQ